MVRQILNQHGARLIRYAGVSVVGVVAGQTLLFVFYQVLGWQAIVANSLAVAVATVPSYLLNRAWVWKKAGAHSFGAEILPFWGMAFLGLMLSNLFVHLVERRWESWILINLANLSAFGLLWIVKYMVLDRVLFAVEAENVGGDALAV
jgi:putative flippase GtrA